LKNQRVISKYRTEILKMINELKEDAETRMGKSVASLKNDLTKLRTGRAHTSLLDHITVEYYGSEVPLSQVANISVLDSRTLSVSPWEKPMVQAIEKAIMNSDMGLNPATTGELIRIPLPPLTEERRKDMIKLVRAEGEGAKVAIRNIRRDVLSDIKALLKEKEITEDEERQAQDEIQKITDKYVKQVDEALDVKEKDLMEI
jgi:ribosome recycling factor